MGEAIPHRIGRHVHAKARPDETTPPPAATGIDYLHLVEAAHTAKLAQRLAYSRIDSPPEQVPGQLTLPGTDIQANTTDANTTDADTTDVDGGQETSK
ncbi:MAG TPA: hypothetical protein VFL99_12790 [Segeticoccus sp.]|uniref:hypothetical protein n=1 Tax=Segeticoccus sp. TaxID=2706531 RepID=UPI002D7E2205|nr:hypothetical protein [Segeticoccus sp.]HET8601198.1 hypothetical protein [Segeticoccus sp.]